VGALTWARRVGYDTVEKTTATFHYVPRGAAVAHFSLRTLLFAFVVVWSTLAVFGLWTVAALPLLLAAIGLVRSRTAWNHGCLAFAGFVAIFWASIVVLSMILLTESREEGSQCECRFRLREIGRELQRRLNPAGGSLPDVIRDPRGNPLLSWRVAELPAIATSLGMRYMGQPPAAPLNLTERWDSAANRQVATQNAPSFRSESLFHCPSRARQPDYIANYVAVTGPGTLWPPNPPPDILARPERTLIAIEWPDSDIWWTEPRDVTVDELFAKDSPILASVRRAHCCNRGYFLRPVWGFHGLFGDGSVRFIRADVPDKVLKSLCLANAPKPPVDGDHSCLARADTFHYAHCAALIVWVAVVVALFVRQRRWIGDARA
jgi:hypothetical protein